MMMAGGTLDLATQLRRAERRGKQRAVALTLPLLAFLVVFFLVPLASLLVRAVLVDSDPRARIWRAAIGDLGETRELMKEESAAAKAERRELKAGHHPGPTTGEDTR